MIIVLWSTTIKPKTSKHAKLVVNFSVFKSICFLVLHFYVRYFCMVWFEIFRSITFCFIIRIGLKITWKDFTNVKTNTQSRPFGRGEWRLADSRKFSIFFMMNDCCYGGIPLLYRSVSCRSVLCLCIFDVNFLCIRSVNIDRSVNSVRHNRIRARLRAFSTDVYKQK